MSATVVSRSTVQGYVNDIAKDWIAKHNAGQFREPKAVFNLCGTHCELRRKSGKRIVRQWKILQFPCAIPALAVANLSRLERIVKCHATRGTRYILRTLTKSCKQKNGRLCCMTPTIIQVASDYNGLAGRHDLTLTAYFCIMPLD